MNEFLEHGRVRSSIRIQYSTRQQQQQLPYQCRAIRSGSYLVESMLSLSLSLTLSLSFFLSSLKVVQRQDNGGVIDSKLTNGSSAREPVNNPPTFQCRTQDFQVAIPTLAKNQKAKGQMKVIKISVTLFCRVNRLLD